MADYTSSLTGCCADKPSCVDSVCCFGCQIGFQHGAAGGQAGTLSICPCLLSMLGCAQCCACMIRRKIAENYGIGEGCITSCLIAYICFSCSLCQTHREFVYRGTPPGGICVGLLGGAAAVAAGGLAAAGGAAGGAGGDAHNKGDRLSANQELRHDDYIIASSGHYVIHQKDGNVVLYNPQGKATWATNTAGSNSEKFIFQGDGNIVLYGPGNQVLWSPNIHGQGATYVVIQGDGNFVAYAGSAAPWASNTCNQ